MECSRSLGLFWVVQTFIVCEGWDWGASGGRWELSNWGPVGQLELSNWGQWGQLELSNWGPAGAVRTV